MRWKVECGDWTRFRKLPGAIEVDFQPNERGGERRPTLERMDQVYGKALDALKRARKMGLDTSVKHPLNTIVRHRFTEPFRLDKRTPDSGLAINPNIR